MDCEAATQDQEIKLTLYDGTCPAPSTADIFGTSLISYESFEIYIFRIAESPSLTILCNVAISTGIFETDCGESAERVRRDENRVQISDISITMQVKSDEFIVQSEPSLQPSAQSELRPAGGGSAAMKSGTLVTASALVLLLFRKL